MDYGDGQQSNELDSALKRFDYVCNSLIEKKEQLLDLEVRRQKLQKDLESLRNEIKNELNENYSHSDGEHNEELEFPENTCEHSGELVEPATLDTASIKEFIQIQRNEIESLVNDEDFEQKLNSYLNESGHNEDNVKNSIK